MTGISERMQQLAVYGAALDGYEKGEAQVFCDRLFQAFGHDGYKEAGATLEFQVKQPRGKGTKFADLLWRPRILIEMKSRGEPLEKHYRQAFEYWINIVPDRPRYVVLCNFDEFWIYDFNTQLDSPVDRVGLADLVDRYEALNFLFPDDPKPLFGNDKVQVTREAADKVANVFNALIERKEPQDRARRFILQCVVAMFAEDFDLLPKSLFSILLNDCVESESSYDLIGGLFRQMSEPTPAHGGRFQDVRYFNGGLFKIVDPVDLTREECALLLEASLEKWTKVAPPIFGTLFQHSMGKQQRHALGAHFTSEADIQKVVLPSIVVPWRERIAEASTLVKLEGLMREIHHFRVLDPACGSGNFLYIAYRELVNLQMEILEKVHDEYGEKARVRASRELLISTTRFHGIDIDPFGVELAKVTLMLGKRIAVAEMRESDFAAHRARPLEFEKPLPLDNLDANIIAADALFTEWPQVDVIIGNPPYQSKNKIQKEYGVDYVNRVRKRYPAVPGRADYCVYWFRRAHDELGPGRRAGLVGTNTIRQNYSREGGLDYIVSSGGTITNAVSTQAWSGDAAVHVSIVNWVKGDQPGPKLLFKQLGDAPGSPWEKVELDHIAAALSGKFDVTRARKLRCNADSETTHQGQTHGHAGFLVGADKAERLLASDSRAADVLFPFLTFNQLLKSVPPRPNRYVIDFHPRDVIQARAYPKPFSRIEKRVLPTRQKAAQEEKERNAHAFLENPDARLNHHHGNFLKRWWLLSYPRAELMKRLAKMDRYIVCGRVTKRPIFVFLSTAIHPNDALQVFTLDDDYSFGILQSANHWEWFVERCSTLTARFRYTSDTVYDSFPWPQCPTLAQVRRVAEAAVALRHLRQQLVTDHNMSLRDLYRSLEQPGANPLKDVHAQLDDAVREAYGMRKRDTVLEFVFELNRDLWARESSMKSVVGPGLPPVVKASARFISSDSIPFI